MLISRSVRGLAHHGVALEVLVVAVAPIRLAAHVLAVVTTTAAVTEDLDLL